mmetsp:Transcript_32569/g.101002  ORF Transcript_32569/g.101002 Transcript_32569/m.101002 type:complete len:260 (+) Transcript_32569:224-1003(+)
MRGTARKHAAVWWLDLVRKSLTPPRAPRATRALTREVRPCDTSAPQAVSPSPRAGGQGDVGLNLNVFRAVEDPQRGPRLTEAVLMRVVVGRTEGVVVVLVGPLGPVDGDGVRAVARALAVAGIREGQAPVELAARLCPPPEAPCGLRKHVLLAETPEVVVGRPILRPRIHAPLLGRQRSQMGDWAVRLVRRRGVSVAQSQARRRWPWSRRTPVANKLPCGRGEDARRGGPAAASVGTAEVLHTQAGGPRIGVQGEEPRH